MTNKLVPSLGYRFAIALTIIFSWGLNLNAQTYCTSKGNLPWTEWIAGVKFGTINNASVKEGYGDFTSQITNLTQGTSYPLSITQGFSYAPDAANATQQGRAWIDYNKNGTFEATELVAFFTRTTTTANVVVPTTALTGATRMRVSLKTIGAPTACEVFDKGEVEDYMVNIQAGTTQSCANNALNFDGVNDIVVSSRTAIPANADFTLEASCISTATSTGCSGAFRRLLVFDLSSSRNRFEIGDCAGQLTLYYYFGGIDELVNIPNATTLRNGNWHHISVVKQGTNLMIYYDGTLVLTRPNMGGVNPAARQLIVGSWVQPIENWQGSIDEVKVWNYAMTATEVQAKRLCQPTGTETNLLLYYPFNQGASSNNNTAITSVLDKSLSANNGTLQNFALTGSTSNFVCSTLGVAPCVVVPTGRDTLRITNVTGPTTAEPNGTLPLSITIKNFGAVASKADSIGLLKWYSLDGILFRSPYSLNKIAIPIIAAGQTITVSGSFQMPATLVNLAENSRDLYVGIDVVVKSFSFTTSVYYNNSTTDPDRLGYRFPIKPATITDLALTATPIQTSYLDANLGISFKVKIKNRGTKAAKNVSVSLMDFGTQSNGYPQFYGIKNVRLISGLGVVNIINLRSGIDQNTSTSMWQLPILNGLDSTEATFTADVANGINGPVNPTANNRPYIRYADIQDSNLLNDTAATLNYTKIVVNNTCRYQDSLQLVSLYNATNGANWTKKWNLATPINTWFGVTLNANGCVEVIQLNSNQLTGTLPNLSLSNLLTFNCIHNNLTGSIPNFNFPKLEGFYLSENQLSGAVPNLNSPNLSDVQLSFNQLTGSVPNFNYPNLTLLTLQGNQLTGSVPNFNLSKLVYLELSSNQLTGAIPNFNLPSLRQLYLNVNRLTGSIPNFNSPNLTLLLLNDNQLSGAIPSFSYPNLEYLFLDNNNLSGCIPTSLKANCGKNVTFNNNPLLATQSFTDFCANGLSACVSTNDLAVTIAATPSVYRLYQTNTFKITVKNLSSAAFTNVKIQFRFPAKTVSGGTPVPTIGTWQEWCPGGVQCFTWTIPTFAGNTTATLDVPLFILDTSNEPIVATTTLLSSTPADNNANNNYAAIAVNPATAPVQAPTQALAFKVPTQLIPVIIQRISPNPTEGDVQIKLDSWTKQTVDFNFSDITGKTIYSEKRDLEKGVNRLDFDVYHLPQGVYFIQTNVGKGKNMPTKFVKM